MAAPGGSTRVIIIAFFGNFAIALTKLTAALMTGASAMMAEAIHSFVDSGNQLLMLHGVRQSRRPADARHPFGYGMEVYFWSFVVAVLLFSIGAIVSIYEGIEKIQHPHPVEDPWINYLVLGLALIFEGYALRAAWLEMRKHRRPRETALGYARRSKDAALFTVLFEDAAAMLGLAIAGLGLVCAQIFDAPALDGWASVGVGVLLAVAAVFLATETKSLLIGEAAEPELLAHVAGLAEADKRITRLNEALSMHLGPHDVLLTLSIDFVDDRTAGDVEASIAEMERAIKGRFPQVRRVFIEAQSRADHLADRAAAEREGIASAVSPPGNEHLRET